MKINHYKKPTEQQLKQDVQNIVTDKNKIDSVFETLESALGCEYESPLHNSVYILFDHACDLLCDKHQIDNELFSWFIFDLDCGKSPTTEEIVNKNGEKELVLVNDVDSFIKIVKHEERKK
jgi:hypothetical protein